jgi:hypothetical protein
VPIPALIPNPASQAGSRGLSDMRRPVLSRLILRTLVLGLFLLGTFGSALADDDELPYLEGETQKCESPAMLLKRPHDGWQFVDLEKMRKKAEGLGEETKGYRNLRFRLWFGSKRAEIFVRSWIDEENREKPLTTESFALLKIEHLKGFFEKSKLKKPKLVKFGKRPAVFFTIQGKLKEGKKKGHAILCAVCVREEDKTVAVIQLECDPKHAKSLKKDLLKLLKHSRF